MNVSRIVVVFGVVLVIAACKEAAAPTAEATTECPTTGARACKDATDCGGSDLHCTGGRCFANQAGCSCSDTAECGSSAHCAKGLCYPNVVGVPCTSAGDCGASGHCSGGGCYTNNTGSPCSADPECGPGSSCVSGTCN